ncbi:hypothetical protein ACTFIZ_005990 [Dictyostelium cf. discoideum]
MEEEKGIITVDYQVHMTYFYESAGSIGTDGCSVCVGIIARKTNGNHFCAHFSSSVIGNDDNFETIRSKAAEIIQKYLKNDDLEIMSCCTLNYSEKSSQAIFKGLVDAYGKKVRELNQGQGIFYKNGTIGIVTGSNIRGATLGPNDGDGPIDIPKLLK